MESVTVLLSKINAEQNYQQIKYCHENFDKLDWKDLINRSKEYLSKDHEVGGRCQIDIKTGEVKVAIEIKGENNHVDTKQGNCYGPLGWHTHLKGLYPSYPDLYCSLASTHYRQTYWQMIIYKDADGPPCLMLYKPIEHIARKMWIPKYDYYTLFGTIVTNIDRKYRLCGDVAKSISMYFNIRYIGKPRIPPKMTTLSWQRNFLKKSLCDKAYKGVKKSIKIKKGQTKVANITSIAFGAAFAASWFKIVYSLLND